MTMKFSNLIASSIFLALTSCGVKSGEGLCETPSLTLLAIGDMVPETAVENKGSRIMTSPSQGQPHWTYSECGVNYTLGVDKEGYIQFLATNDKTIIGPNEISVGTSYSDVKRITGRTASYYRGWMHFIPLSNDWKAGFYVISDSLPKDARVNVLIKSSSAGYGQRN